MSDDRIDPRHDLTPRERALIDGVVEVLADELRAERERGVNLQARVIALELRLATLEQRIDALEQRPGLEDKGVWRPDTTYQKGDGVSYGSSFWIAQAATTDKPGDGRTAWRLAVKRGSDGKPGPPGPPGRDGRDGKDAR